MTVTAKQGPPNAAHPILREHTLPHQGRPRPPSSRHHMSVATCPKLAGLHEVFQKGAVGAEGW